MAAAVDITGKPAEEVLALIKDEPRQNLVDLVLQLASVERWLKPREIAALRRMNVRDVRAAIKRGELGGGYFRRSDNSLLVPTSALAQWDRRFFVSVTGKDKQ